MGKKLPHTPNSQIKSALRRLFLRSREHSATLRRDSYTCSVCGAKQSKAKGRECRVEVHHKDPIRWAEIIAYIRETLLVDPKQMTTLCIDCHDATHKED